MIHLLKFIVKRKIMLYYVIFKIDYFRRSSSDSCLRSVISGTPRVFSGQFRFTE